MRASGQPPEPPAGLAPPAPRACGAAAPAPLVAAGRPPTPTRAAEADGVAVAPADGPPLGVEVATPVEGVGDGTLEGAGCALGETDGPVPAVADGVAAGFASAGTST